MPRACSLFCAAFIIAFSNGLESAELRVPSLPGWEESGSVGAWPAFHASCGIVLKNRKSSAGLANICKKARALPADLKPDQATAFFETNFTPVKLTQNSSGFMTGYYEPEFPASRQPTARFSVPLLRKPSDLIGVSPPGHPELVAARRLPDGRLVPYPDRAMIEAGALKHHKPELFWLSDAFHLFTLQIQGSGRLKLTDGKMVRIAYDGKNGQPYTAIGKVLIDRGILQRGKVSMQAIGAVFKRNPQLAREVMQENKSYVFFRELKNHDPKKGPLGAQGVPLTPWHSIAVDHSLYEYGLPFYIDGQLSNENEIHDFYQLAIAQDTGTAIKGKARIDLFLGAGTEAEEKAGVMQQPIDLYLLQPNQL